MATRAQLWEGMDVTAEYVSAFPAGSTCVLTRTRAPRTYLMWQVRHRWAELPKESSIKKNGGNFCSWPRRSVKDQINPPTLTKIRQNTQQNSGHQAVRTVTSERWETWGKPYDCPAYCRERVQTTAKGQETPSEPRGFHVKETEWEATQATAAGRAGQRPERSLCRARASSGALRSPWSIQQSPARCIFVTKLPGRKPQKDGETTPRAHKEGKQCLQPVTRRKTHHSQEAG